MAQLIQQFVGHSEQKSQLLEMAGQGHLPSSIILQGPSGVGKKTLAKALLQVVNCEADPLACGQCSNCRRSLDENSEFIFELKPETKKVISVDQVRELHHYLSLKSLRKHRFVLIDPADRLTTQAANALLKVLEEAPPQTHFFLITERISSLMATIRSRSHRLTFSKLSREDLGLIEPFSASALDWADGRVQIAQDLSEKDSMEKVNGSLKFLYSLTCESPQDWKKMAPWFFNSDPDREFGFQIWNQALEKRLYRTGENLDWLPEGPAAIAFIFDKAEVLQKDIRANVDKLLAVENFYYQIRQQGTI